MLKLSVIGTNPDLKNIGSKAEFLERTGHTLREWDSLVSTMAHLNHQPSKPRAAISARVATPRRRLSSLERQFKMRALQRNVHLAQAVAARDRKTAWLARLPHRLPLQCLPAK
jgi:hypothetical protein